MVESREAESAGLILSGSVVPSSAQDTKPTAIKAENRIYRAFITTILITDIDKIIVPIEWGIFSTPLFRLRKFF
jgi:hypothetical protein